MASERTRNIAVGLTMILALALLMYGILLLGKGPNWFGNRVYAVTVEAGDANGLAPGAKVNLMGVGVGQVKSVTLEARPDNTLGAKVVLAIDSKIDIPANAKVSFGKGYVGSTSFVTIYDGGGAGFLPKDGSGVLRASTADNGLIPREVFDDIHTLKIDLSGLTRELTQVAKDMHALLEPSPPGAIDNPDDAAATRPAENISTMVTRLSQTVKSLQSIIGDPAVQGQVRDILHNLADTTGHFKETLAKINSTMDNADKTVGKFGNAATQASSTFDVTQKQILVISEKLVATLDQLQKTTRQISEGNGTTGKLINDPRLYEGLVDVSKSLKSTVDDIDLLVKKVNDEGVGFHLGK